MAVTGLFICVNLRMMSLPLEGSRSLRGLPIFSFPEYPEAFSRTRSIEKRHEIEAWDKWAESPVVGSYQFDKGTAIHYPHMDLQSHYHDTKPNLSMTSLFLKDMAFPEKDAAVLTRKGNKFNASGVKSNQDRVVVLSFPNQDWWIGLFDGHGFFGHATSQYASLEFPKRLLEVTTKSTANPEEDIKGIFRDIQNSMPLVPEAGSTAISLWKRQDQLYISNVGDSTAFVASYDDVGNVQLLYTTKPHKPDTPEERARILSMGGEVIEAPMPGASARLLIADEKHPENSMALAMSRSLGDHEGAKFGLSPEPTTDVLDLKGFDQKKNYMVVAASDGLLDKVNAIDVAKSFAQSFLPSNPLLPLEAAEKLILQSSEAWRMEMYGQEYRDDISVAVHRLRL
jgi:serine/threonine protein phosphatase PrpC